VQHRSSTSSTGLYPYHTVPILTGISWTWRVFGCDSLTSFTPCYLDCP
jgi:hypothetical protein